MSALPPKLLATCWLVMTGLSASSCVRPCADIFIDSSLDLEFARARWDDGLYVLQVSYDGMRNECAIPFVQSRPSWDHESYECDAELLKELFLDDEGTLRASLQGKTPRNVEVVFIREGEVLHRSIQEPRYREYGSKDCGTWESATLRIEVP